MALKQDWRKLWERRHLSVSIDQDSYDGTIIHRGTSENELLRNKQVGRATAFIPRLSGFLEASDWTIV